jgi:hypothetical protein
MPIATVIEFDALWQTIWTAALAGIGVTIIYSVAVLGFTRTLDLRREDRPVASFGYFLLALLGGAGMIGAMVYGIVLITQK